MTMLLQGYVPPRDQMRGIVGAAREFRKIVRQWKRHSSLPGYPVERGNHTALKALFGLERALNPGRLAWGSGERTNPVVRNWPDGS